MAKVGISTRFEDSHVLLIRRADSNIVASGTLINGLYTLDLDPSLLSPSSAALQTALLASQNLWHERSAHANISRIEFMVSRGVVKGIELAKEESFGKCIGCVLGKSH